MNAEVLLKHFDRISDAPEAIQRLRQFILDLAVRGKLVEQYASEEPASTLLNRIGLEKSKLIESGEIKSQQLPTAIRDEEIEFHLPSGWCWARLATISRRIQYGFTASADRSLTDVRLLRITDIQNNSVDWSTVPGCQISEDEVTQYRLSKSDILIARTGGTIGKTFLVAEAPPKAVFASYLIRVQPSCEIFATYLKAFLESPIYWKQLQEGTRGTGQPNVNGQTLGRLAVALPPLAEQHRIVAKVEELMALCDRLEEAQKERECKQHKLTAATIQSLHSQTDDETLRANARFFIDNLPST